MGPTEFVTDDGFGCRSYLSASLRFVPGVDLVLQETLNPRRAAGVHRDIERDGVLHDPISTIRLPGSNRLSVCDGHNRLDSLLRLGIPNVPVQELRKQFVTLRTWLQRAEGLEPFVDQLVQKGLQVNETRKAAPWEDHCICFIFANGHQYEVCAHGELKQKLVHCTTLVTDALAESGTGDVTRIRDVMFEDALTSLTDVQFLVQFQPRSLADILQAVDRGERVGAGMTRFLFPRVENINLPLGDWLRKKDVTELNKTFAAVIQASSPHVHIIDASLMWLSASPEPQQNGTLRELCKLVGNTPLVPLANATLEGKGPRAFAKCEYHNLSGSSKARPALQMILEAPAGHLLDAGSGGTAQAEAEIAEGLGRPLTVVVPENIPQKKIDAIRAHGATVLTSPAGEGSEGSRRLARELYETNPEKYVFLDQYSNPANWQAHLRTADEIYHQTKGLVTDVFAGVGTGGTTKGIAVGLKAQNPNIRVWGVMPANRDHRVYGLKFVTPENCPPIFDRTLLHELILVTDQDAYNALRLLDQHEQLRVGPSSGAVFSAWLARRHLINDAVAVLVFHDHAGKYGDDLLLQQAPVARKELVYARS